MYNYRLHQQINEGLQRNKLDIAGKDNAFGTRFIANATAISHLYTQLYGNHPLSESVFESLLQSIHTGYKDRSAALRQKDQQKEEKGKWFLSNEIAGMSLYVDRFCGSIAALENKLDYFKQLGVNLLHLMPVFQSPEKESDGGYAVSDFRTVDKRFGSLEDLLHLQQKMESEGMYLMIDIVLNHTSHEHAWAQKALSGDPYYQDFYYMFNDRLLPNQYDYSMPEIFPESSPGNFTYLDACNKWVMTVFHHYQWDLNFRNPLVLVAMLDTIFFYANLGVDILRIDAPAFIWKELGTTCQNLPEAHCLLQLIKQCVMVAAPGMALLGEAIVAPAAIMKYFGTGLYTAAECDFAYNATQMALQWDALATGDTKVMLAAQHELLQKPYGTSWITYTRCHDDIGLGYEDYMIEQSGYNAYEHRKFLKEYYAGIYPGSPARGALFSVNPKTQDARISGALASLCGLEKALEEGHQTEIDLSIQKILLMQAQSFFIGGVPMIFYGDETGHTNDYSYLQDPGKYYDNRWMHRPIIDWEKNSRINQTGTIENRLFNNTRQLLQIRRELQVVGDYKNLTWITPHNSRIAGFIRKQDDNCLYCLFNFSSEKAVLTWYAFKENGNPPARLYDKWSKREFAIGQDHEHLEFEPYAFYLFETIGTVND